MYNRYTPQPDGSFRRNRMPEASHPPQQRPRPTPEPPHPEPVPEPDQSLPYPQPGNTQSHSRSSTPGTSVTGFLRRLLPKEFDTGDLLVVILLLLMAGDCAEDQNTALLTLALYFLM